MAKERDFFAAFIENADDIEIVNGVAKQLNLKNYEVVAGGIKEAIELYGGKKSPSYLIVDISKSELPVSDMAQLLELCTPNVKIIAVGAKNEVSLYRDLIKIGIYEYLLTPLFSDIMEHTLNSMLSGQNKVQEVAPKAGKLIVCMGARGGVGTTFVASNLAAMLSSEKLRRVALIDLDPYFGTLSLNFDLKPNPGLKEALENPGRIDQILMERMLTPINERLVILSSEEPFYEKAKYKPEGLEEILKYLSKQFHYIIIDISHSFNDIVSAAILKANIMILLTDASVAGLRDTGRLMHFFHREANGHRCILVMNKYEQYGKAGLKITDFEDVIKDKVNHVISYDNILPMELLNQGRTLVNENNALANSIRTIMFDILGLRQTREKGGWFKKLF